MIESDSFSYEMSKLFLGLFVFFFFPAIMLLFIYFSVTEKSLDFLSFLWLLIPFYVLFILIYKKSKTNYYEAKMDDNIIRLKKDGESQIELSWEEVMAIQRVPLMMPPMYFLKTTRLNKTIVFPTSNHLGYFSIAVSWFVFIWDFSKMGRHIRKMKREKKIESFYKSQAMSLMRNMRK